MVDHGGIPVESIPIGLVRAGADERILWRGTTAGAEGLVEVPRHETERLEAGLALAVLLLPMAWAEPMAADPAGPLEEPT